jgi:hypothetical protein
MAEIYFPECKRLWEIYRETSIIDPIMMSLCEADLPQDLDNFDLIARDLNKFKRLVN